MKTNLLLCAFGLVAFVPCLFADPQVVRTVDKVFTVAEGGQLRVNTGGGGVKIVTGAANQVAVTATQRITARSEAEADKLLKNLRLTIEQRRGTVSAAARYEVSVDSFANNPVEVDFVVSVPARFNIDLKTAGGDVTLSDIAGKVTVTSMGGDVTTGRIDGDARVTSGGGDVKLAAVTGALTVSSLGGDVEVREVFDAVKIGASGGDLTVTFAAFQGDSSLNSASGDVHVIVKQAAAFQIDARAPKGQVSATKSLALGVKEGGGKQHQLSGAVNGGGESKLKLRSNSGDITIESVP